MSTRIASIQPREVHFRTQTNADWLDGLIVWQSGESGVVAGSGNVGNGSLIVSDVAPQAILGHHLLAVTSIEGLPRFTITHPTGAVTSGVAGLPLNAFGLTLTLNSGSVPFAVDDTFAISVLPVPIDITGIAFTLQARSSATSANIALQAQSAPNDGSRPSIAVGTTGGEIAMAVPAAALVRNRFLPGTYVYDIIAAADGRRVPAFFGTIEHVDGVSFLP